MHASVLGNTQLPHHQRTTPISEHRHLLVIIIMVHHDAELLFVNRMHFLMSFILSCLFPEG